MVTDGGARLPRDERRETILQAATRLLARHRLADVRLAEVAREAGITRAIVYRHVTSKDDLYRQSLVRARSIIESEVGPAPYDASIVQRLFDVAARRPEEFRLLFAQAPREPSAADLVEDHRRAIFGSAADGLSGSAGTEWDDWMRRLVPELTLTAVITWLDAGEPNPDAAAAHVLATIERALSAPRRS